MSDPRCRICGSRELELAWDLAPSPYGDLFRETRAEARNLSKVGLTLMLCAQCSLLQVTQKVDAYAIYQEYLYQSSVTSGLSGYYRRLSKQLAAQFGLMANDLVIDVGSNDGTVLKFFRDLNFRILGIEPSRTPAASALASGVPTINGFLDTGTVAHALNEHGQAKLVCANYVAANVPEPVAFFRALRSMLAPDGAISIITGYHPDQFTVNMFDYINHDHLSYFSVYSAVQLAAACDLKLTSATRVEHKGGSIHLTFHPIEASVNPDESVNKLLQRERWTNVNDLSTYSDLSKRIESAGSEVRNMLSAVSGSEIAGIGASISTTHLLHQFEIGDRITYLFDDDPQKIGRFSPGYGIEVRPLDEIGTWSGSETVILAWQHSGVLVERVLEAGFVKQMVVPLPKPHIINVG